MATALYAAPLGVPRFKSFLPTTGLPNVGGKVSVFVGGTSTPDTSYPTYNDALNGTNVNANPVILDAAGEATIFVQAGRLYKIVVADSTGATLSDGTIDNINPATGYPSVTSSPFFSFLSEWVLDTNSLSRVSGTQFKSLGSDMTQFYHPGRRVRFTTPTGFGTVVSSSFSTDTTVTIAADPGSGVPAVLVNAWYGLLSYGSPFAPSYLDPRTALMVVKSGTQTGFAGGTKLSTWTVENDNLSEWSAANNQWVATFPGIYDIVFTAEISDTGVNIAASGYIIKNGEVIGSAHGLSTNFSGPVANNHSTIATLHRLKLAAGDTIQAWLAGSANLSCYGTVATQLSILRQP